MARKSDQTQVQKPNRHRRGFSAVSGLIQTPVRKAGEKRGFAVMRLLTHWTEIVGEDLARIARPVKVGYGREGFGATLTVLTTGANAPILQTQLPLIREKVNACYGYSAISRVHITQTAPTGFSEGQAMFEPAPKTMMKPVSPEIKSASVKAAEGVEDESLRKALENLGQNVLARKMKSKG